MIKAPSDDGGSPVTQYKVEMRDVDRRAWNDVGELNITSNWEDIFDITRSYAALRAADLDWIVGPGYSLGRVHSGEKP